MNAVTNVLQISGSQTVGRDPFVDHGHIFMSPLIIILSKHFQTKTFKEIQEKSMNQKRNVFKIADLS